MAIQLRCDCGRKLKLRDNLAGKQIRCPDCAEVLDVPAAEDEFVEEVDPYEDERPRRSSSRKGGRKAPPRKSGVNGTMIALVVGGGVFALLVIGLLVYALTRKPNANDIALNPIQQPVPVAPIAPPANPTPQAPPSNPTPEVPATNSTPPVNPATPTPVAAANPQTPPAAPGQDVWCVVSNFKQVPNEPGRLAFGNTYTVDFNVASGQFDPAKKYVLYVRSPSPGGIIEHYLEVDLPAGNSGTVKFSPGPGFQTNASILASVAYRKGGRREFEPVSGEIAVGAQPSSANRPPTVQELAGAAAQGKLVAIANAKWDTQGAARVFSMDFVLQAQADGPFYFVVGKSASGNGFETDVTSDIRTAKQGEKKTFGLRLIGPPVTGPLTVHIEKRNTPGRIRLPRNQETPEVVSNSVQVP